MPACLFRLFLLLGPCSLILATTLHAQSLVPNLEVGRPFLTCFSPAETGGGNQEWAFAQDHRGVLYIGDNLGVLEYDGASWRLIMTATNNVVRALDVDDAGRVFVGSSVDFGYLAPDAAGEKHYISLLDYVPEGDRVFNDVWTVYATTEGVYFQARERIFRFSEASDGTWQVKVWRPEGVFYYAFWLDGVYYVHQGGMGLMKMTDDVLELLPGGEQFAGQRLQVMLPFDDGTYLVGPFSQGLFRFDGQGFMPFASEVNAFLRTNTLYKGTVLPDGTFGLTTIAGGYTVIDQNGRRVQMLDKSRGLPSDILYAAFVDRTGLVWLSPENSICQYEARSPLTRYGVASGLDGFTSDIIRHKGVLYISTSSGPFYLDAAAATFKTVNGVSGGNPQTWSFLQVDEDLLLATGTGIYQIEGSTAQAITQNVLGVSSPQIFHRSRQDPNRIFVGRSESLTTLRREAGIWIEEGAIPGINQEIRFIVEPEPGQVWLGLQTQGAMRVHFADATFDNPVIDRFGPEDGLPGAGGVSIFEAAGRLVFAMREGITRFDEATGRFEPDTLFGGVVGQGGSSEEYSVVEDRQGDVWINFGKDTAVLRRQSDGSYRTEKTALLRFADEPAFGIYPEEDGVVWFGGNGSLIRYDPSIQKDYTADYMALVRRVTIGEDSTLFGGARTRDGAAPRLRYADNALRFEYAATSYDNPRETRYASMLEGFDTHWSPWTRETRRNYTNLPSGEYVFRVKALNIYEHESTEALFSFRILPPWYQAWWAYALYAVLFGMAIFTADRVQRERLLKKERERTKLQEVELRAETAEANTKALEAENDRKQNVELLSRIGQSITSTLSVEEVIETVYENVNTLMDATVFGIGLYNEGEARIDFPATKEKGETLPPFFNQLDDENRLAVWCFKNREEVISNDYGNEYQRYVKRLQNPVAGKHTESILYLPLVHQDKAIGVITAQSFEQGAYTEHHVNILRNLATYTAIALDNAEAYRRLHTTVERLNATLADLQSTQARLVQSEKLASLGQLTAGIAHEIKNPLNFVTNFAELNMELADELREELEAGKERRVAEVMTELNEILNGLKINARQIAKHGKRADHIVKNMMEHASGGTGQRERNRM